METRIMGALFIVLGIIFILRSPRLRVDISRGRVRGLAGPACIILGILLLAGVIG